MCIAKTASEAFDRFPFAGELGVFAMEGQPAEQTTERITETRLATAFSVPGKQSKERIGNAEHRKRDKTRPKRLRLLAALVAARSRALLEQRGGRRDAQFDRAYDDACCTRTRYINVTRKVGWV